MKSRHQKRVVLGVDAVAVIERLATIPWENIRELTCSTGLSPERVETALIKLKAAGLVDTWPKGFSPGGRQ